MNGLETVFICCYASLTFSLACEILVNTAMRERFHLGRYLQGYCLLLALHVILTYGLFGVKRSSLPSTLLALAVHILYFFARYRYKGVKMALCGVVLFMFTLVGDLIGSLIWINLVTPEQFDSTRRLSTLGEALVCNTLPWLYFPFLCAGIRLYRRGKRGYSQRAQLIFHYVRPVLLSVVTVLCFGLSMGRASAAAAAVAFGDVVANYALCLLLLLVSLSYLAQDVRYLRQLRRNESLEQQKRISDALMTNMRVFRHNIANMLYGFEGVILAGEPNAVRAYYDEIVRKCALVHNENIVMLQNLSAPSVTALLLRHIAKANDEGVPFNVYIQKGLRWRGLPPADMCGVLGVLLDNAREAAKESAAPYVSVEMRDVDAALEIIVRNTWGAAGQESAPDFTVSGKPGHAGVGIESVRAILKKRRDCYLNLRTAGRYVEAQILME